LELIYYLAADVFKIKTQFFNLKLRVGVEYDGTEARLPDGVFATDGRAVIKVINPRPIPYENNNPVSPLGRGC